MKTQLALFLIGLTLSACSYPLSMVTNPDQTSATSGSFNSAILDQDPQLKAAALSILQQNCASCHTASSGPANVFNVTDPQHLFGSGLLVAGDPARSPLFLSIQRGTMPPRGPLSAADQATLRNFIVSAAGASGGGSTGGPVTPPPPPTPEPTYSYISKNILGPQCASCHYAGHTKGGYAFDTYASTLRAINKAKPTSSVLYSISQSGEMPPRPRSAMNSQDLNLILTWIEKGALNN